MANPIPEEGFIPHLTCTPCKDAIEFYKKAFGAVEICRVPAPDGKRLMHAAVQIDGKSLYLADDFPEYCQETGESASLGRSPMTIHRFVKDCDAAVNQAVKAGATLCMPVEDMFWGDRYGMITDPYGHRWSLATHTKDLTPDEILEGMQAAFAQSP